MLTRGWQGGGAGGTAAGTVSADATAARRVLMVETPLITILIINDMVRVSESCAVCCVDIVISVCSSGGGVGGGCALYSWVARCGGRRGERVIGGG